MERSEFRIRTLCLAFPDGRREELEDFEVQDGETPQQAHERICRLRGASHVEYRASGFAPLPVDSPLKPD